MKFKIYERINDYWTRNDLLGYFLFQSMMHLSPDARNWEKDFKMTEKLHEAEVDLKITLNGVELDFNKWFDGFEQSFNGFVKDKAQEILKEHFGNIEATLMHMADSAQEKLKECLPSWERKKE